MPHQQKPSRVGLASFKNHARCSDDFACDSFSFRHRFLFRFPTRFSEKPTHEHENSHTARATAERRTVRRPPRRQRRHANRSLRTCRTNSNAVLGNASASPSKSAKNRARSRHPKPPPHWGPKLDARFDKSSTNCSLSAPELASPIPTNFTKLPRLIRAPHIRSKSRNGPTMPKVVCPPLKQFHPARRSRDLGLQVHLAARSCRRGEERRVITLRHSVQLETPISVEWSFISTDWSELLFVVSRDVNKRSVCRPPLGETVVAGCQPPPKRALETDPSLRTGVW